MDLLPLDGFLKLSKYDFQVRYLIGVNSSWGPGVKDRTVQALTCDALMGATHANSLKLDLCFVPLINPLVHDLDGLLRVCLAPGMTAILLLVFFKVCQKDLLDFYENQ